MPSPTSLQRGMVSAQAPHFNTPLLPEFGTSTRKSSSSFPEVMSYQISIKFTEKRLLQIPEGQIPKRGQPLGPCTLPVFPTGAPNDLHSRVPIENGHGDRAVSAMTLPTAHLFLTLGLCPDLSYRSPAQEGMYSLPSRKQIWDSGSLFISRPMKNSEPKSSEGTKPPYFRKPTS